MCKQGAPVPEPPDPECRRATVIIARESVRALVEQFPQGFSITRVRSVDESPPLTIKKRLPYYSTINWTYHANSTINWTYVLDKPSYI